MIHVYAPEVIIAMQKELQNHPKLLSLVAMAPDWNQAMGEIALYCGILLDGWYDPEKLMDLLVRKLKEKNTIYVGEGVGAPKKNDPELIAVQVRESKDAIHITAVKPPKILN